MRDNMNKTHSWTLTKLPDKLEICCKNYITKRLKGVFLPECVKFHNGNNRRIRNNNFSKNIIINI